MWEVTSADVDLLKESPSPGRALTAEEETRLLDAASRSRCRSLYPVVMLALNTRMRASLIRGLEWEQSISSPAGSLWANPRRDTLSGIDFEPGMAQNWAQYFVSVKSEEAKLLKTDGEPPRTRTWNPLIKSQLLYQLS
jgi:hypothetical protein